MPFMEQEHRLPFATIIKRQDDIAELIIDDQIELGVAMVEQMHRWLRENLRAPFSLVVNRIHSYSYSADAQFILGSIEELNVIAEVVYSEHSRKVVEMLADFPREIPWKMRCFNTTTAGLAWAVEQQATVH